MDSRHTSAMPQAAWRPSLLPAPGAAPRRAQAEPVRLLAALRQDAASQAGAAAVSGLQSCLASLAALAFAGLGAALLLHWSPSDETLAAHASLAAVPAAWAEQASVVEAAAVAQPGAPMPAPAPARIERLMAPQTEFPAVAQTAASATLASAAIAPAAGARAVSAKAAATHAPRHVSAARHRDGPAAAAKAPAEQAPMPAPAAPAPLSDGEGAAVPPADPDAALLQAVMELHERHAPPPAPRP